MIFIVGRTKSIQRSWFEGVAAHGYVFKKYISIKIDMIFAIIFFHFLKPCEIHIILTCFNKKFIDTLHYTGVLELLLCLYKSYSPQDLRNNTVNWSIYEPFHFFSIYNYIEFSQFHMVLEKMKKWIANNIPGNFSWIFLLKHI